MDVKHSHYKKDVTGLDMIDVYRVLDLFGVTDPCIQHACKKLLVTGNRGHKNTEHDIQDAIDTLERWKEMRAEDRQRQSDRRPMTPNVVEYSSAMPNIETLRFSVVDEPASQMQDDSPRMAAIGQNGNGGEHYPETGVCGDCGAIDGECIGGEAACKAQAVEP